MAINGRTCTTCLKPSLWSIPRADLTAFTSQKHSNHLTRKIWHFTFKHNGIAPNLMASRGLYRYFWIFWKEIMISTFRNLLSKLIFFICEELGKKHIILRKNVWTKPLHLGKMELKQWNLKFKCFQRSCNYNCFH